MTPFDKRHITFTVATLVTILITVIGGTWMVANQVGDIKNSIQDIQQNLATWKPLRMMVMEIGKDMIVLNEKHGLPTTWQIQSF